VEGPVQPLRQAVIGCNGPFFFYFFIFSFLSFFHFSFFIFYLLSFSFFIIYIYIRKEKRNQAGLYIGQGSEIDPSGFEIPAQGS
jgi:hypothetical protein